MLGRSVDALALGIGWASVLVGTELTAVKVREDAPSVALAVLATVVTMFVLEHRRIYTARPALSKMDESSETAASVITGAMLTTVAAVAWNTTVGLREMLLGILVSLALVFIARGYVRAWGPAASRLCRTERVAVIGTGEEAREVVQLIREHPDSDITVLGVIGDYDVARRHRLSASWLGPIDRLVQILDEQGADSALITATGFRGEQFRTVSRLLLEAGYPVRLTNGITRLYRGRLSVQSLAHEPLISVVPRTVPWWQRGAKRAMDVLAAAFLFIAAVPVMLLVALAIKLEDGGPIFFRQVRTGLGGKPFLMTKFRSMAVGAESRRSEVEGKNERSGPLFKVTEDPRTTRVGRFIRETSIDEIPQLLDVLRGEMSLVGPRPALPGEQERFDAELQGRALVLPGITGLWQVEGRSNASFNVYRRLDLHYVENWSVWMDLRILLATAEHVLVSLATVPLRMRGEAPRTDGITTTAAPGPDIDLRDQSSVRAMGRSGSTSSHRTG